MRQLTHDGLGAKTRGPAAERAAGTACVVFSLSARRFTLDFVRVGQLTAWNKLCVRVYKQSV